MLQDGKDAPPLLAEKRKAPLVEIETSADRLSSLEEEVKRMRSEADAGSVDNALAQVQSLADKEHLDPDVLLAQVELLADTASRVGHERADEYRRSLKVCRQQEKSPAIRSLVIKLLGTEAQKRINAAADAWRKANRGVNKDDTAAKPKVDEPSGVAAAAVAYPGMPSFPPMGGVSPWAMWGPAAGMMPGFWGPKGARGGRGGGGSGRGKGKCHFCQELGHYVRECPKIKGQQGQAP